MQKPLRPIVSVQDNCALSQGSGYCSFSLSSPVAYFGKSEASGRSDISLARSFCFLSLFDDESESRATRSRLSLFFLIRCEDGERCGCHCSEFNLIEVSDLVSWFIGASEINEKKKDICPWAMALVRCPNVHWQPRCTYNSLSLWEIFETQNHSKKIIKIFVIIQSTKSFGHFQPFLKSLP